MPQISLGKMWRQKKSLGFPNDCTHQKTTDTIILTGSSHMLQLTYLHINWSLPKWGYELKSVNAQWYYTEEKENKAFLVLPLQKMCKNRKGAYTVGYLLISTLLPYEQYSDFYWAGNCTADKLHLPAFLKPEVSTGQSVGQLNGSTGHWARLAEGPAEDDQSANICCPSLTWN